MLAGALTSERALIITLEATEEAVAVHLAQVKEKGVKFAIDRLNIRLKSLKWKLDFFLCIENLLYQTLT
mgnify:FL=1